MCTLGCMTDGSNTRFRLFALLADVCECQCIQLSYAIHHSTWLEASFGELLNTMTNFCIRIHPCEGGDILSLCVWDLSKQH